MKWEMGLGGNRLGLLLGDQAAVLDSERFSTRVEENDSPSITAHPVGSIAALQPG
ncbi:MAG: hypothetical protein IH991_09370 [Planctomycetes bacterium]|nr:hypothetical protein [Planctomycetota bacterium]